MWRPLVTSPARTARLRPRCVRYAGKAPSPTSYGHFQGANESATGTFTLLSCVAPAVARNTWRPTVLASVSQCSQLIVTIAAHLAPPHLVFERYPFMPLVKNRSDAVGRQATRICRPCGPVELVKRNSSSTRWPPTLCAIQPHNRRRCALRERRIRPRNSSSRPSIHPSASSPPSSSCSFTATTA